MALDRLEPSYRQDQHLVRQPQRRPHLFARTPRRRRGSDSVMDDVGRSIEREERLEPERYFGRDRRDSPGPSNTPAIGEGSPARLPRIAAVLGEDEGRPADRRAGDGGRKPRAALRVNDRGAELAKSRDKAKGQSGHVKRRISTIPDPDPGAAKLV